MQKKELKDINFNDIKNLSKQEIDILNSIKERIEKGESAYKKGWSDLALSNINFFTRKNYNGLNALGLAMIREKKLYNSISWLTFNQMNKINEKLEEENKILRPEERKTKIHLKKGSKGAKISFPIIYDKKNKKYLTFEEFDNIPDSEKNKLISDRDIVISKKEYTVFNGDCFDNLDLSYEKEFLEIQEKSKIEFKDKNAAIKLCKSMNVDLSFRNQNLAFYLPKDDKIVLPSEE